MSNNTNMDMDMMKSMFQQFLQTEEGQKMVQQQQQSKQVANISSTNGGTYASKVNSLIGNIEMADFLKGYLSDLEKPEKITYEYLIQVGKDALREKVAYVEEFNMGLKSGRRRVPTKLDFDDVAIIMAVLFDIRKIQMTDRVEDVIVAVYDCDKDSNRYGTYVTSKYYMYEIMERIAPSFKERDMDDVIDKLKRSAPLVERTTDGHLYPVNNGIYNKKTRELMDYTPEYVYLTKIPVNYVENPTVPSFTASDGYQWDVDSWILDLFDGDKEIEKLIWQVIADTLQPNVTRNRSIWFYSEKGNNGKGTLGQLIKNILGRGNYSSLSVTDFNHEFMKTELLDTVANIADENDVEVYIDSVKDFKASITGDDVNINRKYEHPIKIQYRGTNIQMMNGLPKTKDKSDSFFRRVILVPFMKSFTNNGERTYIKSDYIGRKETLEYVLHKALNLDDFDEFTIPSVSKALLEEYKESNNPVMEFWNDYKDRFVWDLLPNNFLYDMFVRWFERNNPSGKVIGSRRFMELLRSVISTQGDPWVDKTTREFNVRSNGRMDDDEPLITELGLHKPDSKGKTSSFYNHNYKGNDERTIRDFSRSATYRGFERM